jgi:hypothetical protein
MHCAVRPPLRTFVIGFGRPRVEDFFASGDPSQYAVAPNTGRGRCAVSIGVSCTATSRRRTGQSRLCITTPHLGFANARPFALRKSQSSLQGAIDVDVILIRKAVQYSVADLRSREYEDQIQPNEAV